MTTAKLLSDGELQEYRDRAPHLSGVPALLAHIAAMQAERASFITQAKEFAEKVYVEQSKLATQLQQVTEERSRWLSRANQLATTTQELRDELVRTQRQLATCEQERDEMKARFQLAFSKQKTMELELGRLGSIEQFRSQLVEAVRAKVDRRSAFYREAKVHDEVAEFIEQFQVSVKE